MFASIRLTLLFANALFFNNIVLVVPLNIPKIKCGVEDIPDLRIVGGNQVLPNSWPWMVSISTAKNTAQEIERNRRRHSCGGVLVNREWVLTAAHCLDNRDQPNVFPIAPPSHWKVTAGMHSRDLNSTQTSRWQVRGVRRFFYHPQFQDLSNTAYHDIAMMQLDTPVVFNSHVRPICLPRFQVTNPGWNGCYAAGWGTMAEDAEYQSLNLREVEIPVVRDGACTARYGAAYNSTQHLCGGDWFNGKKDSCKGDSGGPLACRKQDGTWYVAGIVSWGMGCGRPLSPGIYTKVTAYEKWILAILVYFSRENINMIQNGYVRSRRSTDRVRRLSLLNKLMMKKKK